MNIKKFNQFLNEGYFIQQEDKNTSSTIGVKPKDKEKAIELMKGENVKLTDTGDSIDGYDILDTGSGNKTILALTILQKEGDLDVLDTEKLKESVDLRKNVNEDLENHSSDDFYYKDEVTSLCWRLFSKIRKGDINDWDNLNNYVESELLQIKQKR